MSSIILSLSNAKEHGALNDSKSTLLLPLTLRRLIDNDNLWLIALFHFNFWSETFCIALCALANVPPHIHTNKIVPRYNRRIDSIF